MEDNNEFNIYYQYNTQNEIDNPDLNRERKNFLIESQRFSGDNFNFNRLKELLIRDGVDFNTIKQILIDNKNTKHKIKLNPLSECNFNDYKNRNNIYLHLVVYENEISQNNGYIQEIDKYTKKILDFESRYKIYSEEMKKIKNSNILSEINMAKIIQDIGKEGIDLFKEMNAFNNNSTTRSSIRRTFRGKKDLYILYLYCSVLDLKEKNYEETDYFEETKFIYNLFNNSPNISATLIFEPLINLNNNFNDYFENIPDIIHINININFINEELYYNNLGESINTNLNDLFSKFGKFKEISKVKLLILSTSYSQKANVNSIVENFKNVKTIIYPSKLNRLKEKFLFIQELYKNLILKGMTIRQAFDNSNHNNFKIYPSDNLESQNVYIRQPLKNIEVNNKKEIKNKIITNDNFSLKLDFVKYNYHRILGRNNEIKTCIETIKAKSHSISVVGASGAGKKSLVQSVGKYFFERNIFNNILYIELYDMDDFEEILIDKIEQYQEEKKKKESYDNEIVTGLSSKVLLIIIFNSIITKKFEFINVEDTINSIMNKYSDFIFLYTCTIEGFNIEKTYLNSTMIKLDKLKRNNVTSLLEYINEEIIDFKENKKTNEFKNLKKLSDYPNYFFLEAMLIKKLGKEKALKQKYSYNKKTNASELLNDFINQVENEYKLKNILPLFYILKLGIRGDILNIFFEERETAIIKNNLNYLIMTEEDSKGNNYLLDGYFRQIFKQKLEEKSENNREKDCFKDFLKDCFKDCYKNYLLKIMEIYAKIFRYIVNYSYFPYNLCKEFHAGINQGFWFSLYKSDFIDKYKSFSEHQNTPIFFDDIRYFNNIRNILEDAEYFQIIKENIQEFKEFISQIVICFSTILHFTKNTQLLKKMLDIFERSLTELKLEKDILRLKYFKYWSLEDSSYLPDEVFIDKIESLENDNELYDEMKLEICLIKIYNLKNETVDYQSSRYPSFEECQRYAKKGDYLNLIRLNIIYGIAINSFDKKYFVEAYKLAKKIRDNKLEIVTLFELGEFYLNKYEFDEFNKCMAECEKLNDNFGLNIKEKKVIEESIKQLNTKKDEKYKIYMRNKLYFYISEPFFYEIKSEDDDEEINTEELKTESNNSFSLIYELKLKIPKDLDIGFEPMNQDFFNDLKVKFQNPLKFVYIGSDYYNKEGDLFYSDNENFNAIPFSLKDLKTTITKFKNKSDMLILGFLNSEKIAQYFINNGFPNVIYLKKLDELIDFFNSYPHFYFYFQRCFHSFIINLVKKLHIDKKNIKDAFADSEKEFQEQLLKLENLYKDISDDLNEIFLNDIVSYHCNDKENDKNLFEELNINRSNSSFLSQKSIISTNSTITTDTSINDFEILQSDKNMNIKFSDELSNSDLDYLINKRYYGNKKILNEAIKKLLEKRIINIFGKSKIGKTTLCLEIGKYFYLNNYFSKGIFYINNTANKKWEKKEGLKDLLNKQNNNKNNELQKTLIILDDQDNLNNCLHYINNSSLYFIIVTEKSLKNKDINKSQAKNPKKSQRKPSSNDVKTNLDDIGYINMNQNLSNNFREEFFNYMKINIFMNSNKELNKTTNEAFELIKEKEDVFINDIIKIIKNHL